MSKKFQTINLKCYFTKGLPNRLHGLDYANLAIYDIPKKRSTKDHSEDYQFFTLYFRGLEKNELNYDKEDCRLVCQLSSLVLKGGSLDGIVKSPHKNIPFLCFKISQPTILEVERNCQEMRQNLTHPIKSNK